MAFTSIPRIVETRQNRSSQHPATRQALALLPNMPIVHPAVSPASSLTQGSPTAPRAVGQSDAWNVLDFTYTWMLDATDPLRQAARLPPSASDVLRGTLRQPRLYVGAQLP